jgi:hypothetical protein
MNTPERIQRKRTKDWRMPPNTHYVGRPSVFGNPYKGSVHAVERYTIWIHRPAQSWLVSLAKQILRGRNLCCWCPLDQPCHADVLLELANESESA